MSYLGRILHTIYTVDCESEIFFLAKILIVQLWTETAGDIAVGALSASWQTFNWKPIF